MEIPSNYENISEWWDSLSYQERRLVCMAGKMPSEIALDTWDKLTQHEHQGVILVWMEVQGV